MAQRILVPVLPSERFYDAVVAAADIVAEEGGLITFLFTTTRPPPLSEEKAESQHESELEVSPERDADAEELDRWRELMVSALADARSLLADRGVGEEQIDYVFGDYELPPAESIAEEAAAGAYDLVVLARGYFVSLPENTGEEPRDIAAAVEELADDGVRLLVT